MEKTSHKLKIQDSKISLDDFELLNVTGYKLESSATGVTELSIKIIIDSSNVIVD